MAEGMGSHRGAEETLTGGADLPHLCKNRSVVTRLFSQEQSFPKAASGIRTLDLRFTKASLCQLS